MYSETMLNGHLAGLGMKCPSHQQSCKLPGNGVLRCLDLSSSSLGHKTANNPIFNYLNVRLGLAG